MSNILKCPFCQRKLKTFAKYKDGTSTVYCSKCNLFGDSKLFSELIRTRKALDVTLDWLGQVATPEKCDDDLCREFTKRKLAEIKTALKQKDRR